MKSEHVYFTPDESAPYSDMVRVDGKWLFLSGLVSEDLASREELYGGIEFETRTVLDNLRALLERYGSDMDHVVRVDVLLRDFADRAEMNREYVKHFAPGRLPARLCYGGVDLSGECRIEIAVIAAVKD